jgi:Uma2 family endonuclease
MTVELLKETPLAPPAGLGPYRRRDYDALPDEPRCELLFGRFYLMTGPSMLHQVVLQVLWRIFDDVARGAGGLAFFAPFDVELADHSIVQPDIMYVSPGRRGVLTSRRIVGAPDLLIEVLSPSTARRDRGEKLLLYAESAIRDYWIVDPERRQIEFLANSEGRFTVAMPVAGLYQSSALPDLRLDVVGFWREVEARLALAGDSAPAGPQPSEE